MSLMLVHLLAVSLLLGGACRKKEKPRAKPQSAATSTAQRPAGATKNKSSATLRYSAPAIVVIASRKDKMYHRPHCRVVQQISAKERVVFASVQAASTAGFKPHHECMKQAKQGGLSSVSERRSPTADARGLPGPRWLSRR